MADGFLGRWSKRKLDAKEGRPNEEPVRTGVPGVPPPQPSPSVGESEARAASSDTVPSPRPPGVGQGGGASAPEPAPTLQDAQSLTPDSDFTRFTRANVAPEVKNAALKKLFADPRFNVQDGLDVYIGDYNTPDPLPEAMLRQLASAKFLKLFGDEPDAAGQAAGAREGADAQAGASVAQSHAAADMAPPKALTDDAHPDLRLQQDDAAEGGEPGRAAG